MSAILGACERCGAPKKSKYLREVLSRDGGIHRFCRRCYTAHLDYVRSKGVHDTSRA